MYEQSTDILGQARFVTVWTRFANDFHTIVVRFQVRSSTVCYGLVRLNTTFTRLTGHLQGLSTVPPTFVRVMLELSHIRVCFDINSLVLRAWLHKFSNFQQRSYKNGRWQNKGIRNHNKTDRHWIYFGQKAWGETRTSQQKEKKKEASLDKRMAQQKWSEGLCSLFCILAGRIFHGGDSFGDLLLLWRHYVASTLLFQGGSR